MRTRECGNDWTSHLCGNAANGFEFILGSYGKTCFDNIDSKPVKLARHAQLVSDAHAATGSLLAVPQRRIKNRNMTPIHRPPSWNFLLASAYPVSLTCPAQSLMLAAAMK
jgi:hypothetical protein